MLEIQLTKGDGRNPIKKRKKKKKWLNPTTFAYLPLNLFISATCVCLSQTRTYIFNTICFYAIIDFMLEAIASVFILVKLLAITD